MPIDFRCPDCGKLLRTADDTAGKQAKCPACGRIMPIPAGDQVHTAPGDLRGQAAASPFAPPEQMRPGGVDDNPYAAPLASGPAIYAEETPFARNGPPWERDRPSGHSFLETVKLCYGSTNFFFSDMRRDDGLLAPLGFALVGSLIGVVGVLAFQFVFPLFLNAGIPFGPFELAVIVLIGLIAIPLGLVIQMFVGAGVWHLALMLVGGARFGFETTFRVVAYSTGASWLLLLIPVCGQYAQFIVDLVFTAIGFMMAHEISGAKATLASILPIIFFCGLGLAVVLALLGFAGM